MSLCWYAIYTASRAEKKVKQALDEAGIENYLPLQEKIRLWSDRKKKVKLPLIPSYIFVRILSSDMGMVLKQRGVVCFIKENGTPCSIPDCQMERFRKVVDNTEDEMDFTSQNIEIGDNIEIIRGELKGFVGELVEIRGKYKLAVRLEGIGCLLASVSISSVKKININL